MPAFQFKQFSVDDAGCGMKICSDSVLLGAWFLPQLADVGSILDAGSGSGLLALIAAQCCPKAFITAIELDHSAALAATANFKASPWSQRLNLIEGDFLAATLPYPADAIISNPPYFTNGLTSPDNARAAARHQCELTYNTLLTHSRTLLSPHGHLGFISPAEFEDDIIFAAQLAGFNLRRLCRVTTSIRKPAKRLLWDFSPTPGQTEIETLSLRGDGGKPSDRYYSLVEPFYTKIQ